MQEVTVSKDELIAKLRDNRDSHAQLYKDAMEGYFVEAKKKLAAVGTKLDSGKTVSSISFTVPVDHTAQYDEVLAMLEMSVEDEITLAKHEFNNYVLDNWISVDEKRVMRGYATSSSNSANYVDAN